MKKKREKKGQLISAQRNSYEKYSLVARRELVSKVNGCKQEYAAQLESLRRRI